MLNRVRNLFKRKSAKSDQNSARTAVGRPNITSNNRGNSSESYAQNVKAAVDFRNRNKRSLWSRLPKFSRKSKEDKAGVVKFAAGEKYRTQRTQKRRAERFRSARGFVRQHSTLFIGISVVLIVVAIITFVGYLLQFTNVLILENIVVVGNDNISDQEIKAEVESEIGRNLLSVNSKYLESKLTDKFTFIKSVYIRKIVPDTLEIEVVERYPVMTYVNLAGAVSIDEEQVVINVYGSQEIPPLTDDELLILDGYGDANSNRVKEKYLAGIEDEEERDAIKWEEVKPEDKQKALADLREDYRIRVEGQIAGWRKKIEEVGLDQLPQLQEVGVKIYTAGEKFDQNKFAFSLPIFNYFTDKKISLNRLLWQTEFNIIAELPTGARILFSSSKDVLTQLQALETLRKVEDLTRVKVVDLRSDLVSVR